MGAIFFGEKDDAFVKKEKKRKNCRLLVDVFRGASVNSGVMSSWQINVSANYLWCDILRERKPLVSGLKDGEHH